MRVTDDCKPFENKLIAYLDGRATPAERHSIEKHLGECTDCRVRAEEFRALWSVLEDVPAVSVSPAFDAALRVRLAAVPVRRRFWEWLPAPRLAFATVALIVLSAWISSMPPTAVVEPVAVNQPVTISDADFRMIEDLPVLENYDVVSGFDVLSELPNAQAPSRVGNTTQIDR